MSIRIKNQWFNKASTKSVEQTATVLASIVWRVAQNMIKQLRQADFDIRVGPMYFDVTREMLIFLLQQVDRMAFDRLSTEQRIEFTTKLVTRVAEILQENEQEWLGDQPCVQASDWGHQFIALYNELMDDYAAFAHDPDGTNFQLSRYFANRLEGILDAKDSHWITDQMIAIEVPQAQALMRKGFDGLTLDEPAKPARSRMSGEV